MASFLDQVPVSAIIKIRDLMHTGIISGGMIPKLEACVRALSGRVRAVRILPAARVETLLHLADGSLREGTEVIPS